MSSGVYGGDEVGAVVLDIGSFSIRGGYAGEDMPKADIPSLIGVIKDTDVDIDMGSSEFLQRPLSDKKLFIDTVNIRVPRKNMELVSLLKDGMIEDWDLFEKTIEYFYAHQMKSTPDQHPLLMSEPVWNVRGKREKLTEIMFEKYNIPAFYLCKNAVLSAFANGRSMGIVLDSGATHTTATPVYDGFVLQQAIVRSPLGGDFVSAECRRLLDSHKIEITPNYLIAEKHPVLEDQPARWKRKNNVEVTQSFHDEAVKEVLRDFAASVLQVPESAYEDEEESILAMTPELYEMPNGYNHKFGAERFQLVEGLFNPSLIKDNPLSSTMLGMSSVVSTSIGLCDIDTRPSLYNSIMVVGGNASLNGFGDRLSVDLTAKIPPSMRLKVISSQSNAERRFSTWIGGSILASLGSFQQLWFSKPEYDESGKSCIERKCP